MNFLFTLIGRVRRLYYEKRKQCRKGDWFVGEMSKCFRRERLRIGEKVLNIVNTKATLEI